MFHKALLILLAIHLSALYCPSQGEVRVSKSANQAKAEEERQRREQAIHNLLISASLLPIEPRADVVLGLLDAPIISDRQKQKEILE